MKILLPVDGSSQSKAAIAFVAGRSGLTAGAAEIHLLNVQTALPARAARFVGKAKVAAWHAEESEKYLKPAAAMLIKSGHHVTQKWVAGSTGECIAAEAQAQDADLIVMGARGLSAWRGLILGSASTATLAHTRRPVLLLRSDTAPSGNKLRVCIAIDGSAVGLKAIKFVLRHGALFGVAPQLTVVHVVDDFVALAPEMAAHWVPSLSEKDIAAMQRQAFDLAMAPVRRLVSKARIHVQEVCLAGMAGDEIAALARKRRFDLLVLGTHGHGAFRAAVLGSVATRVAAHCVNPLLLVR